MSKVQAIYPGQDDEDRPAGEYNFKRVPVRVDIVNVEGLGRTKDDFVQQNVQDVFKAHTFEEVCPNILSFTNFAFID